MTKVYPPCQYNPKVSTWISFHDALEICDEYNLGEELLPLLEFGKARHAQMSSASDHERSESQLLSQPGDFVGVYFEKC